MNTSDDPDLPGDEQFSPLPPVVERVMVGRCSKCPAVGRCEVCGGPHQQIAMTMTLPAEAQANIHHNRLRYAELNKARLGLANEYARTRYRH